MLKRRRPTTPATVKAAIERSPIELSELDDSAWKMWADERQRETHDLLGLLKNAQVRLSIKARALFVLLSPSRQWIPFYWAPDSQSTPNYCPLPATLMNCVPAELAACFASLVMAFVDALPDVPQAGTYDRELTQVREQYNFYLLQLLATAPVDLREDIFAHISLNDPTCYESMDESSGYNPFEFLLAGPNIDELWKRRADVAMRAIVTAELAETSLPRAWHEEAYKCYLRIVQRFAYYEELAYSLELFASQVEFIIGRSDAQHTNFSSVDIGRVYRRLLIEDYRPLRVKLARFVTDVSRDQFRPFTATSSDDLRLLALMIEDAQGIDGDLVARLLGIKSKGQIAVAASQQLATRRAEAESVIIRALS